MESKDLDQKTHDIAQNGDNIESFSFSNIFVRHNDEWNHIKNIEDFYFSNIWINRNNEWKSTVNLKSTVDVYKKEFFTKTKKEVFLSGCALLFDEGKKLNINLNVGINSLSLYNDDKNKEIQYYININIKDNQYSISITLGIYSNYLYKNFFEHVTKYFTATTEREGFLLAHERIFDYLENLGDKK